MNHKDNMRKIYVDVQVSFWKYNNWKILDFKAVSFSWLQQQSVGLHINKIMISRFIIGIVSLLQQAVWLPMVHKEGNDFLFLY